MTCPSTAFACSYLPSCACLGSEGCAHDSVLNLKRSFVQTQLPCAMGPEACQAPVQIGGVSTEELHELELYALKQLDYRLVVSPDEVATRLRELKVLAHSRFAAPGEDSLASPAPQQPASMA